MPQATIDSIGDFKREVAAVLHGISDACRSCDFPDCQGYPWIVPEEEDALLDAGLRLVQFNGDQGPIYLDTFARKPDGSLDIGKGGVACPYRGPDGGCTVHADRPLTCHLYPLSMEFQQGEPVWAVHRDCEFVVRKANAGQFDDLLDGLRALLARLSPRLRETLSTTMHRAGSVSRTTHMDCYTVLGPVEG